MFILPVYLLLVFTVAATWISSVLKGMYAKKVPSDGQDVWWFFNLFQNVSCLLAIAVIFLCSGGFGEFSVYSILFGVVLGFINAFWTYFNVSALAIGPFSYTTVIISLGALIPTVSGLFFGEKISVIQWIGVIFMGVCIILSPEQSKDTDGKKATLKWLIISVAAAVFSGSVGVLQKIHQSSVHKGEMASLLLTGFFVSTVISVFMILKGNIKNGKVLKFNFPKSAALWMLPITCGLAFAFPHSLNLFLAGVLPTVIMFPIVNLAPMILSMVTAIILFKETLSIKRWIGLIIGIFATVLVSGII